MFHYIIYCILSVCVLLGIKLMSNVKTAAMGNIISAVSVLLAISYLMATHVSLNGRQTAVQNGFVWGGLVIGLVIGLILTIKVKMIEMPQTVALLNGLGGLASLVASALAIQHLASPHHVYTEALFRFSGFAAMLALAIGAITFTGSLIAAGKLAKRIPQKQVILPLHQPMMVVLGLLIIVGIIVAAVYTPFAQHVNRTLLVGTAVLSLGYGVLFAIRVGGADMPITISLLNSTSGVAASIAGMAIGDLLLTAIGGIVGASGLILPRIMCRAMNRKLSSIVFAKKGSGTGQAGAAETEAEAGRAAEQTAAEAVPVEQAAQLEVKNADPNEVGSWISAAKDIIIIPGYGMALSQAQNHIKELTEKLEAAGKKVRFAIHPVAGRMPGHMNVLLAEVEIPYDKLFEMDTINDDFAKADLTIVIGASDVINPAASTLPDTPISGMPVLKANEAPRLIICNFDLKPGYAGVANPLYEPNENIMLFLGDAKDSLAKIIASF